MFWNKKKPYQRSEEMQAMHKMTLASETLKADLFNQREQDRYDRQVRAEEAYVQEQKALEAQCKAEGMSDMEAFRFVLSCGYGPRVRCFPPPAKMIVIEY